MITSSQAANQAIKKLLREQRNHSYNNRRSKEIDIDVHLILVIILFIFSASSFVFSSYKTLSKQEIRIVEGID